MHTDAHFTIGHAHLGAGKPCQDYATAAPLPGGGAYAIVSDGCSSGGETDVGARVVALSTAQAIRRHWTIYHDARQDETVWEIESQQHVAMSASKTMLGCDQSDLLATCVYAYLGPTWGRIQIQGDGVVAWRNLDGSFGMVRIEWQDNMPLYPAYADDDYAGFIAAHGDDIMATRLTHEWVWSLKDGGITSNTKELRVIDGLRFSTIDLIEVDRRELVAVFTDGVTQIEGVDWKDAVVELLNFKTTKGAFAKRRMIRYLKDTLGFGRGPMDDIAYAVIRIPQEEDSDEA